MNKPKLTWISIKFPKQTLIFYLDFKIFRGKAAQKKGTTKEVLIIEKAYTLMPKCGTNWHTGKPIVPSTEKKGSIIDTFIVCQQSGDAQ